MSDDTTQAGAVPPEPESRPGAAPAPTPTAPEPAAAPAAAAPAAGAPAAPAGNWRRIRQTRVPLLAAGALLLAGCVLGAGGAAIGALVVVDHHGDRMHTDRYDRWQGPGRGGPGWGPQGPGFGGPNDRHGHPRVERPPVPGAPAPSVPAPTASS
ncbi:hypothetical protein [Actinoplanes sp. NPDC026623]|uniref:hypothetical protein n=1 Tax=Actinoplanes sp. NPDC026623 TaxID=3155610 RepID=UPI0033FC89DB